MKRLMTAALAAVSFALPVSAEIQPGTYDLIDTVSDHLTVQFNTGSCSEPGVVGSYKLSDKTLTLCPGLEVDADDHETLILSQLGMSSMKHLLWLTPLHLPRLKDFSLKLVYNKPYL